MMGNLFVSYVVQMKTGNYYGDAVIGVKGKPQNADNIDEIRNLIKKDLKEKDFEFVEVFIQNWIVLDQ